MSRALTRRALVGAAICATTAGIPASAEAVIPVSDPDAALLDLIARHGEAVAEMHRLWPLFNAAAETFEAAAPPPPDALRWREDDFPRTSFGLGLSTPVADVEGEERREYQARGVSWLREHEPFPAWARRVGAALSEEETEACEARRLEILVAWDRWQGARHDVEVATGHAAAGEASDAAADLVMTLAAEIATSRPRTLPGLRALGAWFARQVAVDDLHDNFLEQLAEAVAGFGVTA